MCCVSIYIKIVELLFARQWQRLWFMFVVLFSLTLFLQFIISLLLNSSVWCVQTREKNVNCLKNSWHVLLRCLLLCILQYDIYSWEYWELFWPSLQIVSDCECEALTTLNRWNWYYSTLKVANFSHSVSFLLYLILRFVPHSFHTATVQIMKAHAMWIANSYRWWRWYCLSIDIQCPLLKAKHSIFTVTIFPSLVLSSSQFSTKKPKKEEEEEVDGKQNQKEKKILDFYTFFVIYIFYALFVPEQRELLAMWRRIMFEC